MSFTAQQLLRKAVLEKAMQFGNIKAERLSLFEPNEIDELYESYDRWGELADPWNEIRYSGVSCDLPATTWSRHYEVDSKAIKIDDIWVQFDYYYGGGKHSEPEDFDYIHHAKIVDCEETQVTVTQYNFSEIK